MQTIFLITNCGRTDLQVLARNKKDELVRAKLSGPRLRAYHQALLDGRINYCFGPEHVELPNKRLTIRLEDPREDDPPSTEYVMSMDSGCRLETDEDGNIVLIPAKLVPVAREIQRGMQEHSLRFAGALIFYTRRDDPAAWGYCEEPIALGPLFKKWLADFLKVSPDCIDTLPFLTGSMLAEDDSGRPGLVVQAAARIDDAIKCAAQNYPFAQAWLALRGGMKDASAVITESAAYRFAGEPQVFSVSEHGKIDFADTLKKMPPEPAASLRVRRVAAQLIRRGDFLGAHAATSELGDFAQGGNDRLWVDMLRLAADYFAGGLPSDDPVPDFLSDVAKPNPKLRCLAPAMRAEAALSAGHFPEAIVWSLGFADAAMIDCIERWVGSDLDDLSQTFRQGQPSEDLKRAARLEVPSKEADKEKKNLALRQDTSDLALFHYRAGSFYDGKWLKILGNAAPALCELHRQIDDAGEDGISPNTVRNKLVHSRISRKQIDATVRTLRSRRLWALDHSNCNPGDLFLAQPKVAAVFHELGMDNASARYTLLQDCLLKAMREHPLG